MKLVCISQVVKQISLRRLVAPAFVLACALAPAARADLIEDYNLNFSANVSGYNNGAHGPLITVTGQFLFDSTLGYVTAVNLNVFGTLNNGYTLPAGGITLSAANTGGEDANDLSASSANGKYSIRFQFAAPLSLSGQFDAVSNQPNTDNGDAQFFDALSGSSGDTYYHIGYYGTSGGAVPEPSSIVILMGSLLSLAFFRRFTGRGSATE